MHGNIKGRLSTERRRQLNAWVPFVDAAVRSKKTCFFFVFVFFFAFFFFFLLFFFLRFFFFFRFFFLATRVYTPLAVAALEPDVHDPTASKVRVTRGFMHDTL